MKTVLIVEDEETLARVLEDNLRAEKYDVIVARNGEEAILRIMEKKPNLVLLDILMPKQNGFNVLGKMKMSPEWSNIPIIILSNLGEFTDLNRAKEMGADDYLVKSHHSMDEIIKKIKTYLDSPGP